MCGFAGFIGTPAPRDALEQSAARMACAIAHRGPDSSGVWADPESGFAVGHQRLAILDLSPAGHQPMMSASGRYVLAFNGEIYNFADLRAELQSANAAPAWRGASDTEVLLAAIEHFGLQAALSRAVGMFALALYDREARSLSLARDRFGEKPLYYGRQGGAFLFGSDLTALKRHPAWQDAIDRDAITLFLRYGYIPAPRSIYEGIRKLEPGTILVIDGTDRDAKLSAYWSAASAAENAAANPFRGSAAEAVSAAEQLVAQSVSSQMIADVPLGAFLSGGIDSSLVVANMQAASSRPVRTFTIGFEVPGYDEADHAAAVARHLGTDHTELTITPQAARAIIPDLAGIYAEPFADASQIPTVLVSRLARQSVTVALSGDGGDEIFSGYDRYRLAEGLLSRVAQFPAAVKAPAAAALKNVPAAVWDALPGGGRTHARAQKFAAVLHAKDAETAYRALLSHWPKPSTLVIGANEPEHDAPAAPPAFDAVKRMMFADLTGYLPDDILVKVDRASMSVGLEARVPLLDHRLVEFALSLPTAILRNTGKPKWIARELLARHMPRNLFERPKMGFSVPIGEWLRGPLKSWADDLLAPDRLQREGYLEAKPVRDAWEAHTMNRGDHAYRLWNVLMFQSWLARERGHAR